MGHSAIQKAHYLDFEIACARLYIQHGLSTKQIAERLRSSSQKVATALTACGITPDNRRHTWNV
jgi:hypothetical protein